MEKLKREAEAFWLEELNKGNLLEGLQDPRIYVQGKPERLKRHSFRIRKIYFDQIVKGTKTFELRKVSARNMKLLFASNPPRIATFVCGKLVHRREITKIDLIPTIDIPDLLGRQVSEQGLKDLGLDGKGVVANMVIKVDLGAVWSEC